MKRNYPLRAIAMLMVALSLELIAVAQPMAKALPDGPCPENTRLCRERLNNQIRILRAYVKRLKPGDPVEFNPQPDPPGDPDPWYRQARAASRKLRGELLEVG